MPIAESPSSDCLTQIETGLQGLLRVISGIIARRTLSVERGKLLGIQFSDARPFTKIVEWEIESKTVREYVLQNTLEAIGFIPYQTRKHKLPRSHPAPLKPPYILGKRTGDTPFSTCALHLNYLTGC